MSDESCVKIEIIKEVPFFGEGDSLDSRLRMVTLRGFPNVKIYENATFEYEFLRPEEITLKLHTPQQRVYRPHLQRISRIHRLFLEEGIDILNLDQAYDFIATSESGEKTEWTMMPPITEIYQIPKGENGKLDYESLIGEELRTALDKEGLGINPEVLELDHTSKDGWFNQINDGTHRIHYGYERGGVKILKIRGITLGFPYYAAPQRWDMTVFATREEALELSGTKIHIVDSPGHKHLYRLFPSGGIMSGEARVDSEGKTSGEK